MIMRLTKKYRVFGNRGFTLLEILVVLLLMALILGISAALFGNTLSGAKRKAAAGEIVAALKYAKHLAVATNKRQELLFDLDTGSYGVKGRRIKKIPEKTRLAISEADVNARLVTHGQYSIFFDATGFSQWGSIRLSTGEKVIQIKPDPVRTALIAGNEKDDRYE